MGTTNIVRDFESIMQQWGGPAEQFLSYWQQADWKLVDFFSQIRTHLCLKLKSFIIFYKLTGMAWLQAAVSDQFQKKKKSFPNSGMKLARTNFPLDKVQLHSVTIWIDVFLRKSIYQRRY